MAGTVHHPRPPATGGPSQPARSFGLGRAVAVVAASIAILLSVGALRLGLEARITDQAVRDDEGYLTGVAADVHSDGRAVVSEGVDIGEGLSTTSMPRQLVGELRIEVESATGPVFVGIAATADVDDYLAGVGHATVVSVEDGRYPSYDVTTGRRVPDPPVSAGIWEASSVGTGPQTVYFQPRAGSWTIVVMRPDGGAPVDARVRVAATAPWVDDLAYAMLGIGLLLGAAGGFGLWSALGRPGRHTRYRLAGRWPGR